MAGIWNKIQWERFEFVDIMHDMQDGDNGLRNADQNKLLQKCLNELGFSQFMNLPSTTQSPKITYKKDSIKFDNPSTVATVDFLQNKFIKDELYKMRNLLDFAVIKYFFIDSSHTPGNPSYSGEAILDKEETKKYSSYFDYSIINDKKLAKVSHKATTANVCDPATNNVFIDQIIDNDGSEIIYSKNETYGDNTKYYGFPYGSIVQTKIIENDNNEGCYIYVQYNTESEKEDYKFSAFYRIKFVIEAGRKKIVKNPHVTYERVNFEDASELFGLTNISTKCQEIDKCLTPTIALSNLEKTQYFQTYKDNVDNVKEENMKYIKQGIEYIVLKALGDRNQSSFLKEEHKKLNTYNSSNTCILTTDSHLIQAAAHTSDEKDYRIQCVYKHNIDDAIIVDSVINKDIQKSIDGYKQIIQEKCNIDSSIQVNVAVMFSKRLSDDNLSPEADVDIVNETNPDIVYAKIKIKRDIFKRQHGNNEPHWRQVINYLKQFFQKLIKKNNELLEDVITKITNTNYYQNIINFNSSLIEEQEKLLQSLKEFNEFIDALLSLIIEKQLSKYMEKQNLFTLFPIIYDNVAKNYLNIDTIIYEADLYFRVISENENFQSIIGNDFPNTNNLYILKLLDFFLVNQVFDFENFFKETKFTLESIKPTYDWFNEFDVYPTEDSYGGGDKAFLSEIQKGGATDIEAVYNKLYHGRDNLFFLKFLYLLNLDYTTIKNSKIILNLYEILNLNDTVPKQKLYNIAQTTNSTWNTRRINAKAAAQALEARQGAADVVMRQAAAQAEVEAAAEAPEARQGAADVVMRQAEALAEAPAEAPAEAEAQADVVMTPVQAQAKAPANVAIRNMGLNKGVKKNSTRKRIMNEIKVVGKNVISKFLNSRKNKRSIPVEVILPQSLEEKENSKILRNIIIKTSKGLTRKRRKRNKQIQTLKKKLKIKLKEEIKQLKKNFEKQVKKIKLNPRKYINTRIKNKFSNTLKSIRRKKGKIKKDKIK